MYCNFNYLYIISIIPYQNVVAETNDNNNFFFLNGGVILINVGAILQWDDLTRYLHVILYRVHLAMSRIQTLTHNISDDRQVSLTLAVTHFMFIFLIT